MEKAILAFCEFVLFCDEEFNFEKQISKKRSDEFKSYVDPFDLVVETFDKEYEDMKIFETKGRILKF
ncbi:MAG: hypothetical protein KKF50_01800 [Nanoarchaeota archaeon]|nr:hypothetical protein [Nanoarchaeota archaeon]